MSQRSRLSEAVPSIVLLSIAVVYCYVSFDYSKATRAMPLGVGALAILLVLVDLASQGEGKLALAIRRVFRGSGAAVPIPGLDGQAGQRFAPARELAAFAWIFGFVGLAILLGFYLAIPIYVTAYLRLYAGKSLLISTATGLCLTAVLYGMFELLLGYEVFGGLITGDIL